MKTGMTLEALAREIMRQNDAKRDFVFDTGSSNVQVVPAEKGVALALKGEQFPIKPIAHGQIAEHVKIPKQYYDRMLDEAPELLANNVETWFKKYPAERLVRVMDGQVRAALSNGFRPLDNYDFLGSILPILRDRKLTVMSCEVTERRMYLKVVDEQLFRDVPLGHKMGDGTHTIFSTCAPAAVLSNSEVGFGRLTLDTGCYTQACTNMALFSDGGMKRTHVGAKHKLIDGEEIEHLLSDRTKSKTDEALWMQVRDVIGALFDEGRFDERVKKITATGENRIEGRVDKVLEVTAKKFSMTDAERERVLQNLINGGDLSQFGLHNAVTRAAQDAESYDRATELEYAGGKIVELPRTEWQELAQAA